jgi:type I restriction enzyme S subunit
MNEWKEYKLGDAIKFGNGKVRPNSLGRIPVYGGNGILDFCNESNYEDETIIIGRVGAYCGAVYYESIPIWVSDNALAAKPKDKFHSKFLYYFLKNLELNQFAEGSSHPLVTQTLLNSIDIYITDDLREQQSIASILSSLDNKIDLLHRQNKTLEQLAETLFRQWFLEEVEDSWQEVKLSTLGKIICGKTPSKNIAEYFGGDIPFIKIPDMHGNTFVFDSVDSLTEFGMASQLNKTIPPKSICVSCIATVGLIVMNAKTSQTNQQINSIIPYKEDFRYFIYLKMLTMKDELLAMASGGTATDNLNTGDFSNIVITLPDENHLMDFHRIVEPIFDKIYKNQVQIRTLIQLRDTLLPKLMSGEVRVK